MAQKYRSRVNYADIYGSNKQGFNLGLDNAIYIRKETTERVFSTPRVGTQGKSVGGSTASVDISAGTDNKLKVSVDGGTVVDVTLTLAGLTTAPAIAAELETKINDALAAASLDTRVWVEYVTDHYEVTSQYTGLSSSVVITDATSDNVADDLELGLANGGTETAGTDDQDFLLFTTGGPKTSQPVESNSHRSGRFHSGIIKKKKESDYDLDTFINMLGSPGASIDQAVALLFESAFGTKEETGSAIVFKQGLPAFTFSMARISTIFGEYYTGAYQKGLSLSFPGEGPATAKHTGMASVASVSGLGKLSAASSAVAQATMIAGQEERYSVGGVVMLVDLDGRTIIAGADGSLKVASEPTGGIVPLTAPVTAPMGAYLAPWHPGAVQQTARDNIFTDLVGSFKLRQGGSAIDVQSIELSLENDHVDRNNIFGKDSNQGFVAGNRATMNLSVTFDLSNENFAEIVQARKFDGFNPEIILGDSATGRALRIRCAKWIPSVPAIEVPENGTTPITLEGVLYESSPGSKDPIEVAFI